MDAIVSGKEKQLYTDVGRLSNWGDTFRLIRYYYDNNDKNKSYSVLAKIVDIENKVYLSPIWSFGDWNNSQEYLDFNIVLGDYDNPTIQPFYLYTQFFSVYSQTILHAGRRNGESAVYNNFIKSFQLIKLTEGTLE